MGIIRFPCGVVKGFSRFLFLFAFGGFITAVSRKKIQKYRGKKARANVDQQNKTDEKQLLDLSDKLCYTDEVQKRPSDRK